MTALAENASQDWPDFEAEVIKRLDEIQQAFARLGAAQSTPPQWFDRNALAKRLCVEPRTISDMVTRGDLPKPDLMIGGRFPRWRAATIEKWEGDLNRRRRKK